MPDEFGPNLVVIGKRNKDHQGENIVRGQYDFPEDKSKPGKLYGRILGSPYAHARVVSVDTSRAEALEGVKATITHEDNSRWSDVIMCVDQEVAAVAAVDEATAERALDLIDVEYEILPHVIDVEAAMLPGANNTGTFPDSNFNPSPRTIDREGGDVEAGFAEADQIIDETVGWLAGHTHNEIEPDSILAWWEGDDMYSWSTNQNPHGQRRSVSSALDLPHNRTHCYVEGTGGAFGGKGGSLQEVTAALLSKKTGKPVAMRLPRRLYTVYRNHQYAVKLHMKMGCKNDGTLTAVESTWWGDGRRNGGRSAWADPDASTWKTTNYKTVMHGIATNKGQSGTWRCVAHPEGQYLSDLILEKMAAKLNMNPLDFRRKIFVTEDMPYQDNGRPMASFGVRKCLDSVAQASGYTGKYHAAGTSTLPDGRMHGIGIHAHSDGHGSTTSSRRGSYIMMNRDGTICFNAGTSRIMGGPGAMCQVIAETIGVKYEDMQYQWGATDTAPDGGGQFGSVLTGSHGAPVTVAARDIRTQLFEVAAEELGVNPEDLDAEEGLIFVMADRTQNISHVDVLNIIREPVVGRGQHWGSAIRKPVGDFPIGTTGQHKTGVAAACEVAVDTDTGEVEILNYWSAIDAGRCIDVISCEGQILGGVAVQVSEALFYDDIYDPDTGRLLSFGHIDDKMATSKDLPGPDKIHGSLLQTIDAIGTHGCHGIGEPCVASFSAITNAINNALGIWIVEAPVTPQKILKALGKG